MIRAFLGAIQFLTVLPVRGSTAPIGQSAAFFPIVGAAIGIIGAALLHGLHGRVPFTLAALLVMALWSILTGALHEDGFADVADAVRAGRPPEKIHAILKDSRVGTYGVVALLFSFVIRWQALSTTALVEYVPAFAAIHAVSRTSFVALAWVARPAGSGLGSALSSTMSTPVALFAIAQGLGFAFLAGPQAASWILGGTTLIVILARAWFHRRLGGVTGDCIGATGHLVEIYLLVLFTCRPCMS